MLPQQRIAIFNAAAFLFHLAVSFLIQFKVFSQVTVGEISDKYPSLFTPAALTFRIWWIIYLSLCAFSIYHLSMAYRRPASHGANRDVQKAGYFFVHNNLAAGAWLIAWIHEYLLLSVVLIFIQLITLILLHNRLCIHDATRPMMSKICTQFPISIYFAWITIATIANLSTYLTAINWNRWEISPVNWTITLIAISMIITIWVMNRRLNVFYGLVVIWAIYGIVLTTIEAPELEPVLYTAYGAIMLIAFHILIALIRNMRKENRAASTNVIAKV